jgi:hypothetical protein
MAFSPVNSLPTMRSGMKGLRLAHKSIKPSFLERISEGIDINAGEKLPLQV